MKLLLKPNPKRKHRLRFIDSLNFIGSSLDSLSESLKISNHKIEILNIYLKTKENNDETLQMCLEKGVFSYEYMSDDSRLMEGKLPAKKKKIYSELKGENISDYKYNCALNLLKTANCETIKDCMNLYLIVDVLLL